MTYIEYCTRHCKGWSAAITRTTRSSTNLESPSRRQNRNINNTSRTTPRDIQTHDLCVTNTTRVRRSYDPLGGTSPERGDVALRMRPGRGVGKALDVYSLSVCVITASALSSQFHCLHGNVRCFASGTSQLGSWLYASMGETRDVWDGSALKHALDDAVVKVLLLTTESFWSVTQSLSST